MAEREGFEPSVELPLHTLSKRAPSTTRPSLRRIQKVEPRSGLALSRRASLDCIGCSLAARGKCGRFQAAQAGRKTQGGESSRNGPRARRGHSRSKSVRRAEKDRPTASQSESLRDALQPLLEVIQHMSDEIRRFDKRIEKLGAEKYPATKRLRSIRGVGPVTALAFVLNLDNNPERLRRSLDADPRMGLRPKRRDSGERSPELSITKTGNRLLRPLLVQCSQYILGHHGEDSLLRRWGLGLAARRPQREAQSDRGGGEQTGRVTAPAVAAGCGLRSILLGELASGRLASAG